MQSDVDVDNDPASGFQEAISANDGGGGATMTGDFTSAPLTTGQESMAAGAVDPTT